MWKVAKNRREQNKKAGKTQVKQIARQEVKKALVSNSIVELKRQRTIFNNTLSTTATIVNLFSGITQGLGDLNVRVGDRVKITKLEASGYLSVGDPTNIIRIIIFLWYNDSTTGINPPTDQQLLDDTTSNLSMLYGDVNNDGSFPKNKKFKILSDKRFYLNGVSKPQINYQFKRTWKYGATTGFSAGTDKGSGIPYMLLVSDSSVAVHPSYYMNVKMHYADL